MSRMNLVFWTTKKRWKLGCFLVNEILLLENLIVKILRAVQRIHQGGSLWFWGRWVSRRIGYHWITTKNSCDCI